MNDEKCGVCVAIGSMSNQNEPAASDATTPEKIVGIYGLRHKLTGKWYVGQSMDIEDRWSQYRRLRCKSQPKLYHALKKYGYDSFDKVVLEKCPRDRHYLKEREDYWILQKDSINLGYNLVEARTSSGPRPKSVRDRISQTLRGHTFSDETIRKISETLKGRCTRKISPMTDEQKRVRRNECRMRSYWKRRDKERESQRLYHLNKTSRKSQRI